MAEPCLHAGCVKMPRRRKGKRKGKRRAARKVAASYCLKIGKRTVSCHTTKRAALHAKKRHCKGHIVRRKGGGRRRKRK